LFQLKYVLDFGAQARSQIYDPNNISSKNFDFNRIAKDVTAPAAGQYSYLNPNSIIAPPPQG
jgi:hypothetical protein